MAKLLGMPLAQRNLRGVNSAVDARVYLSIGADDAVLVKQFARKDFCRLWVHGLNIMSVADVAAACAACRIDLARVLEAIASELAGQALRTAIDEAVTRGVFGTPFLVVNNELT